MLPEIFLAFLLVMFIIPITGSNIWERNERPHSYNLWKYLKVEPNVCTHTSIYTLKKKNINIKFWTSIEYLLEANIFQKYVEITVVVNILLQMSFGSPLTGWLSYKKKLQILNVEQKYFMGCKGWQNIGRTVNNFWKYYTECATSPQFLDVVCASWRDQIIRKSWKKCQYDSRLVTEFLN